MAVIFDKDAAVAAAGEPEDGDGKNRSSELVERV